MIPFVTGNLETIELRFLFGKEGLGASSSILLNEPAGVPLKV
jgi:hypothetical protein